MSIYNPYNQHETPDFGGYTNLPKNISNIYNSEKGNSPYFQDFKLQYPPQVKSPASVTKNGISLNIPPEPLPKYLVNVPYPQYSTSSHAIIETDRVGEQVGAFDSYRDNPYQDWTSGIQFYTIYTGVNPKQKITPVIFPPAYSPLWAADTVTYPSINKEYTRDITDLSMDYSCKSCDIASASLGAPVMYSPKNPTAPLPVQNPGDTSLNGGYTARTIGLNTRDWPQPANPILQLQRRNMGLPEVPILPDYDNKMLKQLKHGFNIY